MKRSEINRIIKDFAQKLEKHCICLPPFLNFTPADWQSKGSEYDEIRDNALGWDITDYGLGDFMKYGLSLITIRNGNIKDERYAKPYAEKLLFLYGGQLSPNHFHWTKMEDIINRGGGEVGFRLWNADENEGLSKTDVQVKKDGVLLTVPAGQEIILQPGESLTLTPYLYHEFYVPESSEYAIIGEVSSCNDDNIDNRFYDPIGRFPAIEEDEPAYRLLCNEYPIAKSKT